MPRIKHFEIAGTDGEKLEAFYGGLFGWDITRRDVAGFLYRDMDVPGELTAGIRHEPQGKAEIVVYIEVEDLSVALRRAVALGAKVRIPQTEFGAGHFALIEDPEGNPIGLTQEREPAPGE